MATAKPAPKTTAEPGTTTEPTTEATTTPTAPTEAQAVDFSASPNWGEGGCFVINEQGQRVPAPAN